MFTRACVAVLLCLIFAPTTFAQTPILPVRLTKTITNEQTHEHKQSETVNVTYEGLTYGNVLLATEYPLAGLSRAYTSGDGQTLNGLAIYILNALACKPQFFELAHGIPCEAGRVASRQRKFDFSRDYVLLSWVGTDISGKRVVYRIGVHDNLSDPYNITLPGIKSPPLTRDTSDFTKSRVYDVFLAVSPAAEHESLYLFSQQPNLAEAQIPDFVKQASTPLFASASHFFPLVDLQNVHSNVKAQMLELNEKVFTPSTITVQVGVLRPPLARAKVKVTDFIKQPVPITDFDVQVKDLVAKLKFVDVRQFVCAKQLADADGSSMHKVAGKQDGSCMKAGATNECREEFASAFDLNLADVETSCGKTQVEKDVREENEARPSSDRMTQQQIDAEVAKRVTAQPKAIEGVDTEVRKFIIGQQPERISGETTFSNTPLVHWNFGALSSFALSASLSKPRVKVGNDGKLAADPLSRPMTLVVVNISPKGFDPDAKPMMLGERLRPFAGIVAAPDFGLGGGLSIGIWKGLGFNIGGAVLFVPTPKGTDQIGSPPSDPKAPFDVAEAKAFFVGASYNFK